MRSQIVFISALLISAFSNTHAQDRCGTVQYEELRQQKNPTLEKRQQFENWIEQKLTQPRLEAQGSQRTQAATYVIPVVVHIIHNGEPIGSGLNLSDVQIQSQINVMNKDFQRMNLDAANTPAEFIPVAGNLDIEFVLAKQDPFGAATNGIQRAKGTKSVWTINDNATFKALSYWPAENYYNIWVLNIPSFLGYAQSPVSNLPGLEDSPDDRLTDGVIVHYTAFGSNFEGLGTFALDSKYNRGRTGSHETGHFFGLRHIWGDDGSSCSGTDYVDDTPNQGGNYSGQCPSGTRTSCSTSDMYMNYMDYTDDACMNMFSQGQNARMIVVLENSPRRFSLLNSIGDEPPPALSLDLALREIVSPGSTTCGGSIVPIIEIQNLGTTTLTSARIQLKKNGSIAETKDFVLNLPFEEITTASFSPILQASGAATYEFEVLLVNNLVDQRPTNNKLSISSSVPPTGSLPMSEIFNSIPATWSRYNPDNNITWELFSTAGHGNTMYVNCYDYENEGAIDRLITPILDLTTAPVAFLKFDRAHAFYGSSNQERLRVLVTIICDLNTSTEIFNLSGSALGTAPATTSNFVPTSSQWETTSISLNAFIGNKIQIAFEVVNGWGNNVYLDNVVVSTDQLIDLALLTVESPGPVTCLANPAPQVRLKNLGSVAITSFTIQATINNQAQAAQTISNISFGAGEETTFTLNTIPLLDGNNIIVYTISNPNGLPDANSLNNTLSVKRIVNDYAEGIPLRENFNGSFTNKWSVISQNNQTAWISVSTDKENSLGYIAFDNINKGEESWLVSPVLDFSKTSKASLFFDVSYANQSNGNEKLRILYSEDCGQTYNNVLYDQSGTSLSTVAYSQYWTPASDEDWRREFINLNSFAGKDQLRFAFVATNDNGNNLYVDNIEYFIDDDPFPVSLQDPYSVYGGGDELKLTFNLTEKQTTYLKIYTMQGQILVDNVLPESLNQTYSFDLGIQGSGIYIVQVIFKEGMRATKVFLSGK